MLGAVTFALGADLPLRGNPLVGAIRWDAWQEDAKVNASVEATLGPAHWHQNRIPFFGRVTGPDSVRIRGNDQGVMDQEIGYAADAGIDYWAFVTYPDDSPLSNGLHLYLRSKAKKRIGFCLIQEGSWIATTVDWHREIERYLRYFKDPCYQTVLDHRPLVYLFQAKKILGKKYPDWSSARAAIDELRRASIAAGTGNPYVVLQGFHPGEDKKELDLMGADALGAYAVPGGDPKGTPYAALAQKAHSFWEQDKQTGAQVIPIVSAGWDHRPRAEHPTPWDAGGWPYFQTPTSDELAHHVSDALQWIRSNPKTTPSETLLIYAWNEHDEVGWICPTWNVQTEAVDTRRLDAIAHVLRPWPASP